MPSLALAYLRERGAVTLFSMLLIALGVATLAILLLVSTRIEERFASDSRGIDLVVGAKGSPLQLVLSSVYHVDTPTGNIPAESLALLRSDPFVARAVPLALGDSFRGMRIVGTDPAFLGIHGARIAQGRMFVADGEAVIGAEAARRTGLAPGIRFAGSHGLGGDGHAHEARPISVTGVLAPTGTVTDRLILTSIGTIWAMHGIAPPSGQPDHGNVAHAHDHGDTPVLERREGPAPDITAILVSYRSAIAAVRLPAAINRQTALQAASPATETARLLTLFGSALDGARLFAWLVAVTGALSVFVILLSAARGREGDMALLRVMGASRMQAAGTILLEGLAIALAGALMGLAGAHGLLWLAARAFPTLAAVGIGPAIVHPGELAILVAVIGLGVLAAAFPAIRVYRADLAETLARATGGA